MTPEEKIMLEEVYRFIQSLKSSSSFPLDVDRALHARGFVQSNLPNIDTILPTRGTTTRYVATISGGTLDHAMIIKDGIIITP